MIKLCLNFNNVELSCSKHGVGKESTRINQNTDGKPQIRVNEKSECRKWDCVGKARNQNKPY